MEHKIIRIKKRFKSKLIGSKKMQQLVAGTLLLLPKNIQSFVIKNVWFVSSFEDSWGFVLDSKDLGSKHMIFLADELFKQDEYAQTYTVVHEIGHVILEHRNALMIAQTKFEIQRQEDEAHKFAIKYINKG